MMMGMGMGIVGREVRGMIVALGHHCGWQSAGTVWLLLMRRRELHGVGIEGKIAVSEKVMHVRCLKRA